MLVSPLIHRSIRHENADLVMMEGELDGAHEGERMLVAPFHIHHGDDELFYVLAGKIGFVIGNHEYTAQAGDAVLVPRGVVHSWWNASTTPARYLITMTKRIDDLIVALHSAQRGLEEMQQLFADHDSTFIGWNP